MAKRAELVRLGSGADLSDEKLERLRVKPWTFANMLEGGKVLAARAVLNLDIADEKLKRRGRNDSAVVIYMAVEAALLYARDGFAWFKAAIELATSEPELRAVVDAMLPPIGTVIERLPGVLGQVMQIAEAEGAHLQNVLGQTNAWTELKQSFSEVLGKLPKPSAGLNLGGLLPLVGAALLAWLLAGGSFGRRRRK